MYLSFKSRLYIDIYLIVLVLHVGNQPRYFPSSTYSPQTTHARDAAADLVASKFTLPASPQPNHHLSEIGYRLGESYAAASAHVRDESEPYVRRNNHSDDSTTVSELERDFNDMLRRPKSPLRSGYG